MSESAHENRHRIQVHNCVLRPRGTSPAGPRLLIGARHPRMLQLVAQYADAWNTAWHTDPAVVKDRYELLAKACTARGRDPAAIEITVGTEVRLHHREDNGSADSAISGSPEEIAHRLQDFAAVGTSHLIVSLDAVTPAAIE